MRLLSVHTYQLHEFYGQSIPPYVILSHRWEEEEVTFRDVQDLDIAKQRKGWSKIEKFCRKAPLVDYVWIDTCCIDKSSSAELSEAINSMFKWYACAEMCYAYLSDVLCERDDQASIKDVIARSKWFTRGWTLQELIAPLGVVFVDRNWEDVATRLSLSQDIESWTGISRSDITNPEQVSVAKRMSWMAGRETTREEDMAYCLLGIFGVNMPLLYGEGEKAFYRLQLEIIKHSDDESIFAWPGSNFSWTGLGEAANTSGLLARWPADFAGCRDVKQFPCMVRMPYEMTNKGLHIELLLKHLENTRSVDGSQLWAAPLNCVRHGFTAPLLIYLRQRQGWFSRVAGIGEADDLSRLQRRQVYVLQESVFRHGFSEPPESKVPGATFLEAAENSEGKIRDRIRKYLEREKLLQTRDRNEGSRDDLRGVVQQEMKNVMDSDLFGQRYRGGW